MNKLARLQIQNFRSLVDIQAKTNRLNVLFGPNGAGKSTFLDTIKLIRDCAISGVDVASSDRSHGIGMLWDHAEENAVISITLETELLNYQVSFGISSGRIEPFVGEQLLSKKHDQTLIGRNVGSDKADFFHTAQNKTETVSLREPEKLALSRYLSFSEESSEASELDRLLRQIHFFHARGADLFSLKKRGSESNYHAQLWERGENLWSVLRNLHDRRERDQRYDTIIRYMQKSFPAFKGLLLEQTGPSSVYGNFIEEGKQNPIPALGVSDGHLQMLIHLTSLFSLDSGESSMILFDEPEISLHPYAVAIFAEAVKEATDSWNRQVFIATHSPVLISQFDPSDILATEVDQTGQSTIKCVGDMDEIKDLLDEYATGSLYMSEMIAAQSKPSLETQNE